MKKLVTVLAVALLGLGSGVAIAYTSVGTASTICKPGTDSCFQCVESGGTEYCRLCEGTKCSRWLEMRK